MSISHTPRRIIVALPLLSGLISAAEPLPPDRAAEERSFAERAAAATSRMEQWRSKRFGLFIHWGPYSKLGGTYQGKRYPGNTEWIMKSASIPPADYRKVAEGFDPAGYDANALVSFAAECGFKYTIITAKHYDGFALFDSKASDFNAAAVLPSKRDLLKEFADACKSRGMSYGFSYSIDRDWYHAGGNTLGPAWDASQEGSKETYLEKVALPQVKELASDYGPVSVMMFDQVSLLSPRLTRSFGRVLGPQIVTSNDFSGRGRGDYFFTDRLPVSMNYGAMDWEKCGSLHDSWGFRQEPSKWKTAESVIRDLVSTATQGGNLLLNVGLDGDGKFPEQARERLSVVGKWLERNGASIYGTAKTPFSSHSWEGGATLGKGEGDGSIIYLHLFRAPGQSLVLKNLVTEPTRVSLLGTSVEIPHSGRAGAWTLDLSATDLGGTVPVIAIHLPSKPVMGSGAIGPDQDGTYHLGLFKSQRTGDNLTIGRTASSADLQLRGFTGPGESASWDVFADRPVSLKCNLLVSGEANEQVDGKTLTLLIDGRESGVIRVAPSSQAEASAKRKFESDVFSLPAGTHRIGIAGRTDEDHPAALTIHEAFLTNQ